MDEAHRQTDKLLAEIERNLRKEYRQATKETEKKLNKYFKAFERKDAAKREQVKNGEISSSDYKKWRVSQLAVGKRWEDMRDALAQDMANTQAIARSIADGYMPQVYAENHNFATYQIEKDARIDTSYTIYDAQSVERLIRENPDIMPKPGRTTQELIDSGILQKWDKRVIQSTMIQGILQGESIPKLAKRMARDLGEKEYKSVVRHARTMTTATQNAGRVDGFKRAKGMGIDVKQTWVATLDGRTRHEHRVLDGQTREVGEYFEAEGYKIRYPGDPEAAYAMIMNCRCTLIGQIKGFERDTTAYRQDKALGGMTYDEWKNEKAKEKQQGKGTAIYKDITSKTLKNAYENHRVTNGLNLTPASELPDEFFNANYGNIDERMAQAFSDNLDELAGKYDTTLTEVRLMTKDEYLGKKNAFAFVFHDYDTDRSTLVINNAKFGDYDNHVGRIKELINNKYCAQIPIDQAEKYVVTHEFAHSLIDTGSELNKNRNWAGADYNKIKSIRKEINGVFDDYITEIGALDKERKVAELDFLNNFSEESAEKARNLIDQINDIRISKYSMENADELMAEAFAQYELGGKSNKYVDRIMEIINNHYRR